MKISVKFGLLSILLALSFAFTTFSALSASAESAGPVKDKAKYQRVKTHKAEKKAIRAKIVRTRPVQSTATGTNASTVCYNVPNWNTTGYTWSAVATYGGSPAQPVQVQPQPMSAAPQAPPAQGYVTVCYHPPVSWNNAQGSTWNAPATYGSQQAAQLQARPVPAAPAQAAAPQPLPSQGQATVRYNPSVSCWNVPAPTWNAPATSGSTWRDTLRSMLPPLPRPGAVCDVPAQPQASNRLTTVCATNVTPCWTW